MEDKVRDENEEVHEDNKEVFEKYLKDKGNE